MKNEFIATIGIECHVQLKTKSKLFSGAANDARLAEPNTLVNHIDFGLPGALPVFNRQALNLATQAALALKTKPQLFSTFDRKHYFYPDLPMGYQITQYEQPIIIGGKVEYTLNGEQKTVGITRAHIEADAGKSTHPAGADYSLVDLNRAGTPLLEIVSEPDMHSAAEAKAYAKELYLLMRYANVTEGDLYHGNIRFDVNVSISKTSTLGTRSETKNLNSFRSVEKAILYEIKRQTELINQGQKIIQETRGWNEAKQKTTSQRTKENADDYRYMPDPDLPPIVIEQSFIETTQAAMPMGPDAWRKKLLTLGLSPEQVETLIEANVDIATADYLQLILSFDADNHDARQLANWLVNIDIPLSREHQAPMLNNRSGLYLGVSELVSANKLSSTNAKKLIVSCLVKESLISDLEAYAATIGLLQKSDASEIAAIVEEVIKENSKAVSDLLGGEQKAIGFLIGQVMQRSKGQANPELAKKMLEQRIRP